MKGRLATAVLALLIASPAYAWNFFGSARIQSIMTWQDGGPIFIRVTADTWCYVPPEEKNLIALLYTIHASGKTANFHCADVADTFGGVPAYRLHRVSTE
ncbi:hypothetical protein [Cognatilysobacter terrigena]|uniref:hypothetical protein n=1 Tax=Cognatilysobacter terrigena TaxID=2488749 RepID=UPI0010604429|nr:hypothetical protein [Lysobacter terrigena]